MIALSKTTWFGKESNVNFNHVQLSSLSQKHGSNKYYKMLKVICYLDMIAFSNCNNFFKITTGLAWILTLLIIFNVVTSVSFEVKLTSLGRSWWLHFLSLWSLITGSFSFVSTSQDFWKFKEVRFVSQMNSPRTLNLLLCQTKKHQPILKQLLNDGFVNLGCL